MPNPQSQALSIPELLDNIFKHLDKRSNSTNIRVCKRWLDVCLPVFWHALESKADIRRLYTLLVPLTPVPTYYELERIPRKEDWERFLRYASLVRTIVIEDILDYGRATHIIPTMRPVFNVFPNLRSLECRNQQPGRMSIQVYVLFMHPNVKRFVISCSKEAGSLLSSWVEPVSRMSGLVYLQIKAPAFNFDAFRDMVGALPFLETIVLPRLQLYHGVIQTVSRLPRLRELVANESAPASEDIFALPILEACLEEGAFPALDTLTACGEAKYLPKFLQDPFFPSSIRGLHLETTDQEPEDVIQSIIASVSEACPHLEVFSFTDVFYLEAADVDSDEDPDDIPPKGVITLRILQPLLTSLRLTTLQIRHRFPISMSDEDVVELARAMPQIEHLFLNETPREDRPIEQHTLTLDVLPPIAEACPRLLSLGLYLETSLGYDDLPLEMRAFKVLREFHVGGSYIESECVDDVALFMVQVLPMGCRVLPDLKGDVSEVTRAWLRVMDMLPTLARMRDITLRSVQRG
ncbi:hypothetical protein Hypma_012527 [Hypsizygus marmoreus]|uniref:F-box domain-containing protein n=1 Tax=Hypsizygus marmoreus TaxID=39966 RepID=A0A369JNL4_HYPMA|nr:hypothetical protein Hypma_012527 [Hypsizygus marmoreus]